MAVLAWCWCKEAENICKRP